MSDVFVEPKHFDEVFLDDSEAMIPVFMDTLACTVQFLRDSLKSAESYQEIPLIDAYRLSTTANLASLSVQHVEEDVAGPRGDCFVQYYHYTHVSNGKGGSNGEGSFRCLLTTATAGTCPTHIPDQAGSSMAID